MPKTTGLESAMKNFAAAGAHLKAATTELHKAAQKKADPYMEVAIDSCDQIDNSFDDLATSIKQSNKKRVVILDSSLTRDKIDGYKTDQKKFEAEIKRFEKDSTNQLEKIPQTSTLKKCCNAIAKCIKAVVAAASKFVAYLFSPITSLFKSKKSTKVAPAPVDPVEEFKRGNRKYKP